MSLLVRIIPSTIYRLLVSPFLRYMFQALAKVLIRVFICYAIVSQTLLSMLKAHLSCIVAISIKKSLKDVVLGSRKVKE